MLKKQIVGAVCGTVALVAGRDAWALDKYLDLEPAETLSGYGYGYDSISRTFELRQCVEFGNGRVDDGGGASGDSFTFSAITSNDQLADAMGLSVGAKFSASMGIASVAASGKVSFFQSTKTDFSTLTILASYSDVEPVKYIAGDINLKPEYLKMVGTAQFRATCGDYVIIGEQAGRWFYGTVQLTVKDTVTESKLAQNGTVDASYATASAHVSESTVNKMKQASSDKDLEIRVTSSGSKSASLTVDAFLAQAKAFPGSKGPKQTYKLKAVPYEAIVANWPPSNPLAPLTSAQKLEIVTSAAYGLQALKDDSDFVLQNAHLFALGTTPHKRDERVGYAKARRAFYDKELNDMRNAAKNCDVDWNGSPACEQLYEKWRNFADFSVSEYEQFPVRYVSDCYGSLDVSQAIASAINGPLASSKGHFSNTNGDREMGGGPVVFGAYLSFKPNFTGGDPLATTTLLGQLMMRLEEAKADHSTFEYDLKVPSVIDLSRSSLWASPGVTYSQCAYKGSGVKARNLDMATCDAMKNHGFSQAAIEHCKKAAQNNAFQGSINGVARSQARDETFNTGTSGVLASMTCTVDSDSSDDTPMIGCNGAKLLGVQLDLTNTADAAADKWNAPKDANSAITPKGLTPNPQHSAHIRELRASHAKARTVSSCKTGLVNVSGACVIPLKR